MIALGARVVHSARSTSGGIILLTVVASARDEGTPKAAES